MRMVEEAEKRARKAVAEGNESFYPRIELAALNSLRENTPQALEWLEHACGSGVRGYHALEIDPFFEKLGADSRFEQLVHRMAADAAQIRERENTCQRYSSLARRHSPGKHLFGGTNRGRIDGAGRNLERSIEQDGPLEASFFHL